MTSSSDGLVSSSFLMTSSFTSIMPVNCFAFDSTRMPEMSCRSVPDFPKTGAIKESANTKINSS